MRQLTCTVSADSISQLSAAHELNTDLKTELSRVTEAHSEVLSERERLQAELAEQQGGSELLQEKENTIQKERAAKEDLKKYKEETLSPLLKIAEGEAAETAKRLEELYKKKAEPLADDIARKLTEPTSLLNA